jgi:hypothetical protein
MERGKLGHRMGWKKEKVEKTTGYGRKAKRKNTKGRI